MRDADMILIPISIILVGFAFGLDYSMTQFEAPFIFKIAGVLFAAVGIYVGAIRLVLDRWRRQHTFYSITSKRVLVISGRKKKLSTLPLKNIDRLDKTEEKDGSGFIIFGNTNPLWPWLIGKFVMSATSVPGLILLPDVNVVFNLLEELVKVSMPSSLVEKINEHRKEMMN